MRPSPHLGASEPRWASPLVSRFLASVGSECGAGSRRPQPRCSPNHWLQFNSGGAGRRPGGQGSRGWWLRWSRRGVLGLGLWQKVRPPPASSVSGRREVGRQSRGSRRDAARKRGHGLKQGHPGLRAPSFRQGAPVSLMTPRQGWGRLRVPSPPWALASASGCPAHRLRWGRGAAQSSPEPSASLLPESPSLPASPTNCAETGEAPQYWDA